MSTLQIHTPEVNNTPPEIHYEPHPAANLFPPMTADEFAELVKDIRENGLINPVVIHDGLILDGRNRFRACKEAGVKVRFVFWENHGDRLTPTQWVLAINSRRRHLTPSQRAAIAVEALPMLEAEAKERMERGRPKEGVERIPQDTKGKARDKAAELTGANPRYVSDAKKIQEQAPELIEQVKAGTITIPQAKQKMRGRKPETITPAIKRLKQSIDRTELKPEQLEEIHSWAAAIVRDTSQRLKPEESLPSASAWPGMACMDFMMLATIMAQIEFKHFPLIPEGKRAQCSATLTEIAQRFLNLSRALNASEAPAIDRAWASCESVSVCLGTFESLLPKADAREEDLKGFRKFLGDIKERVEKLLSEVK